MMDNMEYFDLADEDNSINTASFRNSDTSENQHYGMSDLLNNLSRDLHLINNSVNADKEANYLFPNLPPKTASHPFKTLVSEDDINICEKNANVNGNIVNNVNSNKSDFYHFSKNSKSLADLHSQSIPHQLTTFQSRPKLSLELGEIGHTTVQTNQSCNSKYSEVLDRVNKFEKMAATATAIQESKPLWAYKDGVRTPSTAPPTTTKLVPNLLRNDINDSTLSNTTYEFTLPVEGDEQARSEQSREMNNKYRASITISPKLNRREVSLNGLMTQSLIDLKQSNTNISQISDHILLSNNKVAQDKEKQSSLSSSFHGLVENWPRKHSNPHCDDNVNCGVNGGEGASLHHVTSALNAKTTPTVRKPKPPPPPIRTTPLTAHPPPLPPKGTGEGIQPPPRPRSKELKLDDVLQLCEEYEKQIEQEQIMAKSLSFTSTPVTMKTMERSLLCSDSISPLSLAPILLSPTGEAFDLSPVKLEHSSSMTGNTIIPSLKMTDCSAQSLQSVDCGPPPLSPSSSLTQSRIKTNGSLPREAKRGPSPSRTSLTPTSPKHMKGGEVFNWSREGITSEGGGCSTSDNLSAPSASPRTRIKTTVGKSLASGIKEGCGDTSNCNALNSSHANYTQHQNSSNTTDDNNESSCDYQGGKEELFDTEGKTQEELYTEAKELLEMMTQSSQTRLSEKAPRDKDGKTNLDESTTSTYSRIIIGTGLLGGYARNSEMCALLQQLRIERDETMLEVSRTAKQLKDIEQQMEEANRSLDMETSLLEAERTSNISKLASLKNDSVNLRRQEAEIEQKLKIRKSEASVETVVVREKLASLEKELEALETEQKNGGASMDTDKELELLEKIKNSHEKLEAERRLFEDLEFRQMETEAGIEHDREEILQALELTETSIREAEQEVGDVEEQQQKICYSQETTAIQDEYSAVQYQLNKQQTKLGLLEAKMTEMLAANKRSEPVVRRRSDNATDDAIKRINDQLISIRRLSDKLKNVNRLSDQLSIVNNDNLSQVYRLSDQLLEEQRLVNRLSGSQLVRGDRKSADSGTITWTENTDTIKTNKTEYNSVKVNGVGKWSNGGVTNLNSAGSIADESTDSTSDLPQDSSSPSPSPNQRRYRRKSPSPGPNKRLTKRSSMQRASERRLDKLDGLTSADESYRPCSTDLDIGGITDASSWVGGDCITLRRGGSSRASRPLTRYLPVMSQENFDLRGHIESAGHQIELCSHIVLNSCSCRGYLSKLGARLKVWTKRWFVFDRNKRTLVYYNDKSETRGKGGIYFHSISEVYVDHQTSRTANQRVTFVMKTQDRSYLLQAPSPEAMRIWVDVIFTGAEGYREYQD